MVKDFLIIPILFRTIMAKHARKINRNVILQEWYKKCDDFVWGINEGMGKLSKQIQCRNDLIRFFMCYYQFSPIAERGKREQECYMKERTIGISYLSTVQIAKKKPIEHSIQSSTRNTRFSASKWTMACDFLPFSSILAVFLVCAVLFFSRNEGIECHFRAHRYINGL